jgi:hypothetical protein
VTAVDGISVLALAAFVAGFARLGHDARRFAVFSVAVGLGWAALVAVAAPPAPAGARVLLAAGLGLHAAGLLLLGVMLRRSVSLRLLSALGRGEEPPALHAVIAPRIADLERHGLAATRGDALALTRRGRRLARASRRVRRALGHRP